MANNKQREEARSRKPRHRKNLKMEELPTFTKWLSPFGYPDPSDDGNSKSKRVSGYRPLHRTPVVVLDSSKEGGVVAADVSNLPEEEGPMGDSGSTRGGCCCWQRSKSMQQECSPKFQNSLKRRRVVANVPDQREEEVVAAGRDEEGRGCWCCRRAGRGCLPTFQIYGRRKVPVGDPNLLGEGSGHQHSKSARRTCLPTFHICGRRRRVVAGIPDLHKEEGVATDVSNLRKEEEATVAPVLRKEGRDCCGRCECLPAFQICRSRRRRMKVVAGNEEMTADVPTIPGVEEMATEVTNAGVVNMQEDISEDGGSRSAKRVGCLQAFHICAGRKRVVGDPDTFEKEKGVASNGSNLHKEDEVVVVDVPDLCKEGNGCCFRCVPTFQICGRRRKVDSDVPNQEMEEKVVVGVSDLQEEKVAAAGVLEIRGEVHSKSTQGGSCWSFQFRVRRWLPKFLMCGRKMVVDTSNHQEEEERAPAGVQNLRREEVVVVIPDVHKEKEVATDVPDHPKEERVAAGDIPVLSRMEVVSAGDTPNLHKEETVFTGSVLDLRKEVESVSSGVSNLGEEEEGGCRCFKLAEKGGGRRHRRRSSRSREGCWSFQICGRGWLPTFHICRGRKKVSVSIPNLHEEEGLVVNGVSEVHNEEMADAGAMGVVAATGCAKSTRGCGCWQSKPRRRWLPTFEIFRRKTVATDKEDGGGWRSKSKRRRGWLRRRGRKQREGKERKR